MNFDNEMIDELTRKISKILPEDSAAFREEISQKLKAALSSSLKNMDLVTREEFDIQARLLAKTRAKLDDLQSQIEKLEASQSR